MKNTIEIDIDITSKKVPDRTAKSLDADNHSVPIDIADKSNISMRVVKITIIKYFISFFVIELSFLLC